MPGNRSQRDIPDVVLAAATSCDSTSTIGSATDFDLGDESGSDLGMSSSAGCAPEALFVYLLPSNNSLYRFDPGLKQFTLIGKLGCSPPSGATPNSMAVDRNAMAWVNYVSTDIFGMDTGGWIYRVNTRDASCEPSPSITLPSPTWYRIGMGFSTDAVGGTTETLFVSGTYRRARRSSRSQAPARASPHPLRWPRGSDTSHRTRGPPVRRELSENPVDRPGEQGGASHPTR